MKTTQITEMLAAFWSDQDGVTAIEYALLAALIFAVIVLAVGALGDTLNALYESVAAEVAAAAP